MPLPEPIVIIALPAYNEASVIQSVIEEIRAAGYTRMVIIDDGSRDETWQVAHDAGVTALRHRLNRGKGAATKTAIEAAKLLGADIIVTMDSDGQHNPKKSREYYDYINFNRFHYLFLTRQ